MKLKLDYFFAALFVVLLNTTGFAGHEYGNGRVQGVPAFSVNATYTVQDNKYLANTFSATPAAFKEGTHNTMVKLGIDNLSIATYTNAFDITVSVEVKSLIWSGSSFSSNTSTVNLSVKYNPSTGSASYKDMDVALLSGKGYSVDVKVLSIYDNLANTNLTYAPHNVYLETEIDAERYYNLDFTNKPFTSIGDFNVTNVSASDELQLKWNNIAGAEEYELEWCWVSYDLIAGFKFEIDFKNNATRVRTSEHSYKISKVFEKGIVYFRVRGVGRYDINANGKYEADYFTPWTWNPNYTSFTVPSGGVSNLTFTIGMTGISGNVPLSYTIDTSPHETLKNWQYSATYAEEGKKKEVISYFDGTLRNRQSVTKNNSDNNAIVGETYYDYQGRPAVQALPVPVQDATLKFYEYNETNGWGFNYDVTTQYPYSREHFDKDNGNCPPFANGMHNMRGSAYYYSNSNSDLGSQQAYLPRAENYPFTQTEYTPDLTGRIRRQSNVGPDLKLGTNHETKYFYGSPNGQAELDRLFGSEVGFYNHYKKNMVIDPNGQISVTYTDLSGKTIATALAGSSPINTKTLSFSTSSVSIDLLNKRLTTSIDTITDNNILALNGKELVFTKEMIVTDNGVYQFKYDMTGTAFTYTCSNLCYDCIYDLEIDILDGCGQRPWINDEIIFTPIKKKVGNILASQINTVTGVVTYETNCDGPITFSDLTTNPIYVTLTPGVYTVIKKLSIDNNAMDYYLKEYLKNTDCVTTETAVIATATAGIDYSGCDATCEQCVTALGTLATFTTTGGGTVAQYNELVRQCREPCNYTDECESNYYALLADVSPGGQYAQFDDGSGCNPSAFPVSVLNTSNSFPNQASHGIDDPWWNNTNLQYKNEDGTPSYITITKIASVTAQYSPAIVNTYTASGAYPAAPWITPNTFTVIPQALADVCEFKNRWKNSWAKELVKFHPEYAYYEYCIQNSKDNHTGSNYNVTTTTSVTAAIKTSKNYDSLLVITDDLALFDAANRIKLLDPLGLITASTTAVHDPYFLEGTACVWEMGVAKTGNGTATTTTSQLTSGISDTWNYYKSAPARFNDFKGSGVNLWKYAWVAANCGTAYGVTSMTSMPCYTAYPAAGPAAFNKKEWEMFKMLYKALKQELQNEAAQCYALHHLRSTTTWTDNAQYNSCNDCIGKPGNDPIPVRFAKIEFWSISNPGNWYNNWFHHPPTSFSLRAPCSYLRRDLYANKIKRFPSTSDISGLTAGANPSASVYQLTGKCPLAMDLESTLNEMSSKGSATVSPSTALNTVSAFTKLLYDAVYGGASSYPSLTWNPTVSTKSLTALIKDGSTTKCTVNLDFPTTPSYATWTCTIAKMYDLNFVTYSGGTSKFTIKASVLTPTATVYQDVVLSGTICANIGACAFDPPCTANGNAKALQNLLNTLIQKDLCSSSNIDLTSAPYNMVFGNSLAQLLPSGTWNYTYTGASSSSSISAASVTGGFGLYFTSGMSTLCGGSGLVNSTNSNSLNVVSIMPAAGPTGSFTMLYSSTSGTVTTYGTVTGSITITNTTSAVSGLSLGNCDVVSPLCQTQEHLIKKDLEAFLPDAESKNYFTSATAVNMTTNPLFTPLLQSQINSTISVGTSTPYTVPTVNYYWTNANVTTSVVASNTFVASICSSTTGSAPTPTTTCCSLSFTIRPSISKTQYDIAALGPIVVQNIPSSSAQSYNFYMLASFTGPVYDTLFGSTTCFPIRGCETCTATPTFSTISTTYTVVDDFSTLATSSPTNHTANSGCTSFSTFDVPGAHTYTAPCFYGRAGSITDGSSTYSAFSGQSYWVYINATPATSYSTTIYNKNISIPSSTTACYGLEGMYIKAVDWHHILELYLDNKYIGSQTINWQGPVAPIWQKLNFGGATWNNSSGITSLNVKIVAKPITPATYTLTGDLNTILGLDDLTLYQLPCGSIPCINEMAPDTMPVITYTNPCAQLLYDAAVAGALEDYSNYINDLKTGFVEGYIKKCMGSAIENFSVTYTAAEYQYTLYYYDQAGNLVRTVPPEGVNAVTTASTLAAYASERRAGAHTYSTGHTYKTTYTYNSLNQLTQQETPDAGISRFWYDKLGRLVASQDPDQAAGTGTFPHKYSFTQYDALGRIKSTGQAALTNTTSPAYNFTAMTTAQVETALNPATGSFPYSLIGTGTTNSVITQVVHTYYGDDEIYLSLAPTNSLAAKPTVFIYPKDYLRSRVAATTIEGKYDADDTTFIHATFYNYDIHGNVKELCQINPDMAWAGGHENKKHIQYEYDLISGKVNKVKYQPGYIDQFYHKYDYDADNRITHVYTSRDNVLWDNDAKYFYYKHGPLARVEIGDAKVQGYDYAYTLQGWIKGTNSEILNTVNDIGKDANTYTTSTNYNSLHSHFAKDAMSYNINYFTRNSGPVYDYLSASNTYTTTSAAFKADPFSISTSITGKALYNGNISHMSTSYLNMDPTATNPATSGTVAIHEPVIQLSAYRYDQLNRIADVKVYKDINKATNTWASTATDVFKEEFAYDKNGNITTAKRQGNATASYPNMDNMTYTYTAGSNKLGGVADAVSNGAYTDDIDDMATVNNYLYYDNGNLKRDVNEVINTITWTIYGKPLKISRTANDLTFSYDAMGNRTSKRFHVAAQSATADVISYYVRDAQGNTMASYRQQTVSPTAQSLTIEDHDIYGSSRLGNAQHTTTVINSPTAAAIASHTLGEKDFELSNHLGNVISVVSDHKATVAKVNTACIDVLDFPPGYDVTSWDLQVNGVTATSLAIGAVKVQFTAGAVTGINPANGPSITAGTYLLEFDWNKGNLDANDNLQIEPFDVQWSGGSPINFWMSTPFWTTGTVPESGHYTFTYTPSATGSDIWTHIAFNNWGSATSHTFIVDNISMCPLSTPATIVDYHNPDIVNHQDYYAFGAFKPGTKWSASSDYRYGFNGKENDNEIKGTGNSQDYGMRIYDPRLGRFLSVDPMTREFAGLTPYQFASNTPIWAIDQDGLEAEIVNKGVNTLVVVIQGFEGKDPPDNKTQSKNNPFATSDDGDFNTLSELNSPKLKVVQFSSSDGELDTKIDVSVTIKEYKKNNPHGKVVIVGHSLGADNAIELVKDNPEIKVDYLFTVDISDGIDYDDNDIPSNVKNAINFHGTNPYDVGGEKIKKGKDNNTSNILNIPVPDTGHRKIDNDVTPKLKEFISNIGKSSDAESSSTKKP